MHGLVIQLSLGKGKFCSERQDHSRNVTFCDERFQVHAGLWSVYTDRIKGSHGRDPNGSQIVDETCEVGSVAESFLVSADMIQVLT